MWIGSCSCIHESNIIVIVYLCTLIKIISSLKIVDELKPSNVAVVGAMSMVRNSVGSDAYVADEIITSRAGVRVRVGNTDAEGRMAMADVLCKVPESDQFMLFTVQSV